MNLEKVKKKIKKKRNALLQGNRGARRPGHRFSCPRVQGNKAGWVGWNQSMKDSKCHTESMSPTVAMKLLNRHMIGWYFTKLILW